VRDIRSVGYIATELMNKEAKYSGPLNIVDPTRWPPSSNAFNFITMVEAAYSIEELMKVETLQSSRNVPSDTFLASINRLPKADRHKRY
jgi:hypothetical protein